MMRKERPIIFLYGSYRNNAGPDNVNRYLLSNTKNILLFEKSNNKILKRIERLLYFYRSDVIVFSGFGKYNFWLKYAKLLGKKTIYLMHGCVNYEARINKLEIDSRQLKFEKYFLGNVDLILPVSEYYKKWVVEMFPEFKKHIHFLNSGIENQEIKFPVKQDKDDIIRIVVAGGDRIQKNNLDVAKAVEILAMYLEKKIELRIFGRKYSVENIFEKYPHSMYIGMLPQADFYNELKKADIFILNSEVESFGLSAIDALYCGCDVLISKNSGIRSILSTNDNDIISDVHDSKEIARKIEEILKEGNNSRLLTSIDVEHYSWRNVAERLYEICVAVYNGEDYSRIR